MTITEPGLYPGLDFADYLASSALSSTLARLLTQHVPAKAIERARNSKPTRAMNLGSAAHLQALGSGPQLIVWQHDGRTKDGKAERAAFAGDLAAGTHIAVTADERDQIFGMAAALRAHEQVARILDASQSEVSAFWREGDVWCRARYDLLSDTGAWDYKTTQDVTRRGFSKAMASFGYHQQGEFYERGLVALDHPAAGRPLRFICQETEPPYLVQIHQPDDMALEVAKALNDRALGIFAECTARDEWPGYEQLDAEPVALPGFYFFDNDEALPDEWRLGQDLVLS